MPLTARPEPSVAAPVPRTPSTVLGVALAVLTVVALALQVGGLLAEQAQTERASYAGVRALDLDVGSGDLQVVADGGADARVERRIRWTFRRPSVQERVVDGTLRVRTRCSLQLGECGVSYVVHVPNGTPVRAVTGSGDVQASRVAGLDARTGAGNVDVSGIAGELTLRTGSGDVGVTRTSGRLTAQTGSGNLRLRAVSAGALSLTTGSGDIDAELAGSPDALTLRTGSGDIDVLLPDDGATAYAVSVQTGSGDSSVGVRSDPRSPRALTARTGSGDVRVGYLR